MVQWINLRNTLEQLGQKTCIIDSKPHTWIPNFQQWQNTLPDGPFRQSQSKSITQQKGQGLVSCGIFFSIG